MVSQSKEKPIIPIQFQSSWGSNRKYVVLHFPTSKIWIGYAPNQKEACYLAGWWVNDCFAHYICEEIEYGKGEK